MPIRFAYHPGNVAHSSAPEVDETMRAACRSLDIELIDMPGATSCGAGILGQANRRLQITLNARTMSIAEDLVWTSSPLVRQQQPHYSRI